MALAESAGEMFMVLWLDEILGVLKQFRVSSFSVPMHEHTDFRDLTQVPNIYRHSAAMTPVSPTRLFGARC